MENVKGVTRFGKTCFDMMKKYPNLDYYYDGFNGCCVIPVSELSDKPEIHEEIKGILCEPRFSDGDGNEVNWILEMYDDTEKMNICIRTAESYC